MLTPTFPRLRSSRLLARSVVLALTLVACGGGDGNERDPGVKLVAVGTFIAPTYVTAPPGDPSRLVVLERAGRVLIGEEGSWAVFLDLRERVSRDGEQGLWSLAFAPDYNESGLLYIAFSDRAGNIRVEEHRRAEANPEEVDPDSRRLVLRQRHPGSSDPERRIHYGGQLQFGPDGLLYMSVGEGGHPDAPSPSAQDLGSRLGKLLRIDPRSVGARPYGVPTGNPFADRPGAAPEIYAYGLRNAFRFSFDRERGDLAIADVGAVTMEEVDFRRRGRGAGANFGWRCFEGSVRKYPCAAPGHVEPALEYGREGGTCAVTGGYVVRDRSLPGLYGDYVYADFCTGILRAARLRESGATGDRPLGVAKEPGAASFGEDARGRIYVANTVSGAVKRLVSR